MALRSLYLTIALCIQYTEGYDIIYSGLPYFCFPCAAIIACWNVYNGHFFSVNHRMHIKVFWVNEVCRNILRDSDRRGTCYQASVGY